MNKKLKFMTLDNGLKVILYSDKTKYKISAEILTLFGGDNKYFIDGKGKKRKIYPGTAHYLEHYVYENSKYGIMGDNFYKNDVIDCNAITNIYNTVYYFKTLHNFDKCSNLLIDSVYNPVFDKQRVENTKYPVFNEIRESNDRLDRRNYYKKMRCVFNNFEPAIGNISSVKKITCNYLEEVYKYFYVPKNQILTICGNFDEDKVIKLIRNIYKKYEFTNNEKRNVFVDPSNIVKKNSTITGGNLNSIDVMYKIDITNLNNFDKYKLDWYIGWFLTANFSRYFRVNEYLKTNNIITGDINYNSYYMMGCLFIDISAYTTKRKEFAKIIDKVVNNVNEFSKDDFELVKKESKLRVSVRKDYIGDVVGPFIDNYIYFEYLKEDTIEFIDSLSYDECVRILSKVDFSNRSIVQTKKG